MKIKLAQVQDLLEIQVPARASPSREDIDFKGVL